MKTIDIRLKTNEIDMLRAMIGREFSAYLHDEFQYTQSSSQAVEIIIGNESYYIYSFTEENDYFGSTEDVAVWSVSDEKYPIIDSKTFTRTPINETIKAITLVQENQRVYDGNEQIYDVWLTRGIIFDFGDRQVAFEKDIWFSEEIIVHRGYELIEHFASVNDFGNDWEKSLKTECSRINEEIKLDAN